MQGILLKRFIETYQRMDMNVFIDIDSIGVGEKWSNIVEENISTCDIFVVIVTLAA